RFDRAGRPGDGGHQPHRPPRARRRRRLHCPGVGVRPGVRRRRRPRRGGVRGHGHHPLEGPGRDRRAGRGAAPRGGGRLGGRRAGAGRYARPGMTSSSSDDPRGGGQEAYALASRLPGVSVFDLEVVATESVTPAMRRLRLGGNGLTTVTVDPGQDLMVAVPADGQQYFRRRYTVRRLDRAAGTVDLDVVLHGDGPGARWAATARPGDRVEAIGPRGKITVVADADWHLFAGDESALPATFAMVESLPASVT